MFASLEPVLFVPIGLLVIVDIWAFVVCVMKGKYYFAVFGILFHPLFYIGAIRIAKPDSSWAKSRYGEEKMRIARERFPQAAIA